MKTLLLSLLLFVSGPLALLRAQDDTALAALKVVDDARVAAFIANDHARLDALLSKELRYAHSSGKVDTKDSLMAALDSGALKYTGMDYDERGFSFPAPGIALMSGKLRLQVRTATGDVDTMMSFLAVWREEAGQWRFLAWQSCKLATPPPASLK